MKPELANVVRVIQLFKSNKLEFKEFQWRIESSVQALDGSIDSEVREAAGHLVYELEMIRFLVDDDKIHTAAQKKIDAWEKVCIEKYGPGALSIESNTDI